jgi:NDP-sugar pyrophosphorylase family protein
LSLGDFFRPTAKIGNVTVVERAIKKLRENGFKNIFIIARDKVLSGIFNIVKNGSDLGVSVNYIEEKSSNGTADSLRLAKGKIKGNFLTVYSDIIFENVNIDEIWNSHLKKTNIATLLLTTSPRPSDKGTVKVEGDKILEFVQKPSASDIYLVFAPIFAASEELLDYDGVSLEKDVFPLLAKNKVLGGHLSSEKEIHVHTMEDMERLVLA